MNLFYQDNNMLKEIKNFIEYIKYNQWFEAKSVFISFIKKT